MPVAAECSGKMDGHRAMRYGGPKSEGEYKGLPTDRPDHTDLHRSEVEGKAEPGMIGAKSEIKSSTAETPSP